MRTRVLAALASVPRLLPIAVGADWIPPATTWADVVGIAANDPLNLRAEPSPRAPILRRLPPGAETDLERCLRHPNLAPTGSNWCLVTYAGVTGWVNARFLFIHGER